MSLWTAKAPKLALRAWHLGFSARGASQEIYMSLRVIPDREAFGSPGRIKGATELVEEETWGSRLLAR